jgi:hypothetical protein
MVVEDDGKKSSVEVVLSDLEFATCPNVPNVQGPEADTNSLNSAAQRHAISEPVFFRQH